MVLLCGILSGKQNGTLLYVKAEEGVEREEKKPELSLYAQAAVLLDADSGRVLYGKNEKEVLPMASTTKIMTCILALEYGNPDEMVEVSSYAASMPKVKLYVKQGERYRLGDLLYSLMLESHNDSAVVIAEAVGGSVEGFARMMNQKARDIGCFDSYFITPNGLDAVVNENGKIHSTTATDLARIMAYCVTESPAKESFLQITQTPSYQFFDESGRRSFQCNNHNAFLNMMSEAISGKTGFTNNAGYCYVGAVESEGRIFTVALLACGWPNNKSYKWSDMKKLVTYGMEQYHYRDIYEPQSLSDVFVENGILEKKDGKRSPYGTVRVPIQLASAEENLPYLLCGWDEVEVKTEVAQKMEAPVEEKEQVGRVSYYVNGKLIREYPVLTTDGVEKITFPFLWQYVIERFLGSTT